MTRQISVEITLNEDGYRRLCSLTEKVAQREPDATLGMIVAAVVEIGTTIAEQQVSTGIFVIH